MLKNARHLAAATVVAAAALSQAAPAYAGAEPFIGELMLVGQNWCPRGWSTADGQLLPISANAALFSLYGTTYGGDGRTTFALPDLRGRVALHHGQGPGLSPVNMGEKVGREQVTLTVNEMPSHTHAATAASELKGTALAGDQANPAANGLARSTSSNNYRAGAPTATMVDGSVTTTVTVQNAGGNMPVDIRNPHLGMTWCVALQGIYPSRN